MVTISIFVKIILKNTFLTCYSKSMLYIEDLFEIVAETLLSDAKNGFEGHLNDTWSRNFVTSVFEQIERGSSLSSEQAKIVLMMIAEVSPYLVKHKLADEDQLDALILSPKFRKEPYESKKIPKEVRHVGLNILAFRCKRIKPIIDDFYAIQRKSAYMPPYYDFGLNLWIVPVTRNNIRDVIQLMRRHNFHSDEATDRWISMARESYNQPSTFTMEENIVVAKVYDNPIMALWMRNALEAEPI